MLGLCHKAVADADALAELAWLTGPSGDRVTKSTVLESVLSSMRLLTIRLQVSAVTRERGAGITQPVIERIACLHVLQW